MSSLEQKSTTFHKIIVAIDEHQSTEKILLQAIALAQGNANSLMLLHCLKDTVFNLPTLITPGTLATYGSIYSDKMVALEEELLQELLKQKQAWLNLLGEQIAVQGITVETNYQIGDVGQQICTVAKNWQADLIIIGRRGRKGISEFFLGSVSNYVVHNAPCSVLIVQ